MILEIIKIFFFGSWDDLKVSHTPHITLDFIHEMNGRWWNWAVITRAPNITWDIIKSNPNEPWELEFFSENPNITMDIIKDNPENPWDWKKISKNNFITQKTDFIINEYHKHLMAYRIQYRWKNALVNQS